jgi:hypothetical protein
MHLYAYVANNPAVWLDPTGEYSIGSGGSSPPWQSWPLISTEGWTAWKLSNCKRVKAERILGEPKLGCGQHASLKGEFNIGLSMTAGISFSRYVTITPGITGSVSLSWTLRCDGPSGMGDGYRVCQFYVPYEYDECDGTRDYVRHWYVYTQGSGWGWESRVLQTQNRKLYFNLKVGTPSSRTKDEKPCDECESSGSDTDNPEDDED